MTEPLFRKIVDETAELGETAWLHMFGEPLIDSHFVQRINYVAEKGIVPLVSTNATLLTEEIAHELVSSSAGIIILSIDAASKETYERIRRRGDFDEMIGNVTRFVELLTAKRQQGRFPLVVVQFIRMNESEEEIKEFVKKWRPYPVKIWIKPFTVWGGDIDEIKQHSPQNQHRSTVAKVAPCDWPWRRIAIQADGSVVPCCYCYSNEVVLGNVNTSKIEEIWQGEPYIEFRRQILSGKSNIPICENCESLPYNDFAWLYYVVFGQFKVDRLKILRELPF